MKCRNLGQVTESGLCIPAQDSTTSLPGMCSDDEIMCPAWHTRPSDDSDESGVVNGGIGGVIQYRHHAQYRLQRAAAELGLLG